MFSRLARSPRLAIWLIVGFAFVARVWLAPATSETNLDPDGAHLLNIARCFAEGQGFSNPAAWPAWMQPERLPMPETFKEPAYSWIVSRIAPLTGDWFRTGQWISILAGTFLPWATFALARRRGIEPAVALLAALLVAASPLALEISVRVMVESTFTLVITLLFLAASAPPPRAPGVPDAGRGVWRDALAGALFGLTFLLRAQAMLLVLPLVVLFFERRSARTSFARVGVAALAAVAVTAPLWLRNLRLFGTPLHSDVTTFALWPYVDHLQFSHGLEHPPAIVPFVLAHIPQVLRHMAESALRFANDALPRHILGGVLWLVPLAAGVLLALKSPRTWGFALLYLGGSMTFIFALHWDARYFSSGLPLWCVLSALGAVWLVRAVGDAPLLGPVRAPQLFAGALAVAVAAQLWAAQRVVGLPGVPELAAARAEAPFLRSQLAPNEAVMAITTSYWSWFTHRPSVHLVIADDARLESVLDRLAVRYAALPTSRLGELAARYPGGRLPRAFVLDHVDPARDVSVFAVRTKGAR